MGHFAWNTSFIRLLGINKVAVVLVGVGSG
jgi:hypothetical protein